MSGLRDGKEVTLKRGETTETFTPPTGKMGYGNIDNALALAERIAGKERHHQSRRPRSSRRR